jgi:RNA polymerase primary sigma factor
MTYALERPRPRRRQPNPPHWSHPILPKTEERRLLALAKTGDREARDQLILGNQQLVVRIARRYAHGFLDLDDLVSAGNRGLIHAIETFDPRRAGALSTHAAQWIRAKIVGELEAASYTVRTPRWILTVASKYRKTWK